MNVKNLSLGYFEGYECEVTLPLAQIPPIVHGLRAKLEAAYEIAQTKVRRRKIAPN